MKINSIDSTLMITNPYSIEQAQPARMSFADWITDKISTTNNQLNEADHALNQLASGQTENLHRTMLVLEEAKLSFQYMEQIRNRLMSAYQELLREAI